MSVKLFGNTGTRFITNDSRRTLFAPTMKRLVAWGGRPTAIRFSDVLKAAAVVGIGTAAAVMIFADAKADAAVERAEQAAAPTTAVVQTVGISTPPQSPAVTAAHRQALTQGSLLKEAAAASGRPTAGIVSVNQTEALAMGIDAVISSVPGGELANDVTMVMVGSTIMNRVESGRYPDTVEDVLCQPMQFSCFSETGLKWVGRAAENEGFKQRCMDAAERVLSGERMLSPHVVYVSSVSQGSVEAQLDGLYFCK